MSNPVEAQEPRWQEVVDIDGVEVKPPITRAAQVAETAPVAGGAAVVGAEAEPSWLLDDGMEHTEPPVEAVA
jgi:hypothetical protein